MSAKHLVILFVVLALAGPVLAQPPTHDEYLPG